MKKRDDISEILCVGVALDSGDFFCTGIHGVREKSKLVTVEDSPPACMMWIETVKTTQRASHRASLWKIDH